MRIIRYGVALLAVFAAYLAGYLPEHQQLRQAQGDLRTADRELADLRSRLRVSRLETMLLGTLENAARQDYDQASDSLQKFSIELRVVMARPDMKPFEARLKVLADEIDKVEESFKAKNNLVARDQIRGMLQQISRMVSGEEQGELPAIIRPPSGQTP